MGKSKKIFYRADTNEIKDGVYIYTQNEPPTLSVRNMGMEQATEQRKSRFIANHMTFCMHYIISGKGFLKTKKKTFLLKAGDFFYLFPHIEAEYGPDQNDPWKYAWINFTGENILPFLAQLNVFPESPVLTPQSCDRFKELFEECLANSSEKPQFSGVFLLSLFYDVHALLFHSCASNTVRPNTQNRIASILQYINEHYADSELNINIVANHFGYHRVSLARLLKNKTNLTFSEHLTNARMQAALALMNSGEKSVKTIAYSIGYNDPLYFSTQFSKLYGDPPKVYIQMHTSSPK
ncbi:MAG TPA: AraC family transcriptional regulator [Firmicutes bacterium]|nr:AraC family transcriptional regulator [Bacillota bacterium]